MHSLFQCVPNLDANYKYTWHLPSILDAKFFKANTI